MVQNHGLTPTQTEITGRLWDLAHQDKDYIVALVGLPSVGKTAILETLRPDIERSGGGALSFRGTIDELVKGNRNGLPEGPKVMSVSPLEAVWLQAQTAIPAKIIVVPAMNREEIAEYVSRHKHPDQKDLGSIVDASLGVPLVALRLIEHPQLASGYRDVVAFGFIRSYLAELTANGSRLKLGHYIQMPITQHMAALINSGDASDTFYARIGRALARQVQYAGEGKVLESPIFIAPESFHVYNRAVQIENVVGDLSVEEYNASKPVGPQIQIYAPSIPSYAFNRVKQEFKEWEGHTPSILLGDRAGLFGSVPARRLAVHYIDQGNQTSFVSAQFEQSEVPNLKESIRHLEFLIDMYNMPLPRLRTGNSFFVHQHEHPELILFTICLGWNAESLLQQLNVPYVAVNGMTNQLYAFNPETKHLQFYKLPKDIWTPNQPILQR